MRGGINLKNIITGDNKEEYAGRLVRVVDLPYPVYPWLIDDIFEYKTLQDYSEQQHEYGGQKIGRILPNDEVQEDEDYKDNPEALVDDADKSWVAVKWVNLDWTEGEQRYPKTWISYLDIPQTLETTKTIKFPYYVELYDPQRKGRYDGPLDGEKSLRNTRRRRDTRIANKNLAASKLPVDNQALEQIISHMKTMESQNIPPPTRRIDDIPYSEYLENKEMANWVEGMNQYGGRSKRSWKPKKRTKRTKRRKKSTSKRKVRKTSRKRRRKTSRSKK